MKKLLVALVVANIMILITGCANGCKIEGCKNELYKKGLCEEHYTVIKKVDEQTTMSEESTKESKIEETMIQQGEQKISRPFSENAKSEISEGISPDDYALPECDIRNYNREDLSGLSAEELRLARNEVYARHGRIFSADDLHTYFSSKSWYIPRYDASEFDAKGDSILNEFEIKNRNLIVAIENAVQPSNNVDGNSVKNNIKKDYVGNFYVDLSGDYGGTSAGTFGINIKITDISQNKIYGTVDELYGEGNFKADFLNGVEINENGVFSAQGILEEGEGSGSWKRFYQLSNKSGKPVIYSLDNDTKKPIECCIKITP